MLLQSNRKQYTQQQNDYRIPLSTRFPSSSLSRNFKTSQHEHNLDSNLNHLFSKCPQKIRTRNEKKIEIRKDLNKKSIPEMKLLGLRILACLNQMDKNKQNTKSISSLDNKELQKILINQPTSSTKIKPYKSSSTQSIKISKQFNTQDDQILNSSPTNFQTVQTPRSCLNGSKLKNKQLLNFKQKDDDLGLKKLMVYKKDNILKTQPNLGMIPKLNLNTINKLNTNSSCNTLRNNVFNLNITNQLTPKSQTFRSKINHIITQQIKTIQKNYIKNSIKQ